MPASGLFAETQPPLPGRQHVSARFRARLFGRGQAARRPSTSPRAERTTRYQVARVFHDGGDALLRNGSSRRRAGYRWMRRRTDAAMSWRRSSVTSTADA